MSLKLNCPWILHHSPTNLGQGTIWKRLCAHSLDSWCSPHRNISLTSCDLRCITLLWLLLIQFPCHSWLFKDRRSLFELPLLRFLPFYSCLFFLSSVLVFLKSLGCSRTFRRDRKPFEMLYVIHRINHWLYLTSNTAKTYLCFKNSTFHLHVRECAIYSFKS